MTEHETPDGWLLSLDRNRRRRENADAKTRPTEEPETTGPGDVDQGALGIPAGVKPKRSSDDFLIEIANEQGTRPH